MQTEQHKFKQNGVTRQTQSIMVLTEEDLPTELCHLLEQLLLTMGNVQISYDASGKVCSNRQSAVIWGGVGGDLAKSS